MHFISSSTPYPNTQPHYDFRPPYCHRQFFETPNLDVKICKECPSAKLTPLGSKTSRDDLKCHRCFHCVPASRVTRGGQEEVSWIFHRMRRQIILSTSIFGGSCVLTGLQDTRAHCRHVARLDIVDWRSFVVGPPLIAFASLATNTLSGAGYYVLMVHGEVPAC
jgi:hypothetical protein